MKIRKLFISVLMMATTSSAAHAAGAGTAKKPHGKKVATSAAGSKSSSMVKKPPMQTGAKLSTDMHFDELGVHGRYQSGDEGYAIVEDEKALDDLLDYRKDYKDRLKKSRFQR